MATGRLDSFLSGDHIVTGLRAQLTAELQRACEPVIQQALKDMEAEMRKRLAAWVVAQVEHSYSVERMGNILRIDVRLPQA